MTLQFINTDFLEPFQEFGKAHFPISFAREEELLFSKFYHLCQDFEFNQTLPNPRIYENIRGGKELFAFLQKKEKRENSIKGDDNNDNELSNSKYFPSEVYAFLNDPTTKVSIVHYEIPPSSSNHLKSTLHLFFYVFPSSTKDGEGIGDEIPISLFFFHKQVKLILLGLSFLRASLELHIPEIEKKQQQEATDKRIEKKEIETVENFSCRDLFLHILFTSFVKQLPTEPNQILSASNVNSGITFLSTKEEEEKEKTDSDTEDESNSDSDEEDESNSDSDEKKEEPWLTPKRNCGRQVIIYRSEEWFKVMLHECIHFYRLDGLDEITHQHQQQLEAFQKRFQTPSSLLLFEAYTEFWAEVIQLAILAFLKNPTGGQPQYLKRCLSMLQVEIISSLVLTSKVCHYFGLTLEDVIQGNTLTKERWKENTNVYCYFVLKFIFLFYHSDFLRWCKIHNSSTIQFTSSQFSSLLSLIQRFYQNPLLLQWISFLSSQSSFHSLLSIPSSSSSSSAISINNKLFFSIFDFTYQ